MICPNCRTTNRDSANFCRRCAHILVDTCPACGVDIPEQANYCDNCAYPLTLAARRRWPVPMPSVREASLPQWPSGDLDLLDRA